MNHKTNNATATPQEPVLLTADDLHGFADYQWSDADWMRNRGACQTPASPISIHEVHLGSWRRVPEEGNRRLTFRESAPLLADYVARLGFTHVELLPLMAPASRGLWDARSGGFYAPDDHHGTPQDLMFLIDTLHQRGIGVILDWLPSHFPADSQGLASFDGTHLYECDDSRSGIRTDAGSRPVNLGRREVRSFLLSNAVYWLDKFHVDALCVEGVAAMLGAQSAQPISRQEDLDAAGFLRQFNESVYREFPDVQTIARKMTGWPQVSHPTYAGGLGFGFKWDTDFTRDALHYFGQDPVYRKHHHGDLTARTRNALAENLVLPFPHDEVVPGRGSLLGRMPGDDWRKFANLRLLLAYQFFQPGKKLLFMGTEFGQWNEWHPDTSLDWHLVQDGNPHNGLQKLVGTLNWLYRSEPALHQRDADPAGFRWVDGDNAEQSTLSWLRFGARPDDVVLVVCNFTPVPRHNARVGVPRSGHWQEIFNSDAQDYGGSGQGNLGGAEAAPFGWHGLPAALTITLPPFGVVAFRPGR